MAKQYLTLIAIVALVGATHASAQWGRSQPVQWGMQPAQPVQWRTQGALPNRNLFVGGGIGFGVTFNGGQAYFRGEETIGYHLLNVDEHPGLFVAFTASQGVAQVAAFNFAGRIGFDGTAWQNHEARITVTPSLGLGGVVATGNVGYGQMTAGGFYICPSLETAATFANGFLTVWFRPLSFDIAIRDYGGAAYNMMAGANINLL